MPVPHSPQEAVAEAAGSQHQGTTERDATPGVATPKLLPVSRAHITRLKRAG